MPGHHRSAHWKCLVRGSFEQPRARRQRWGARLASLGEDGGSLFGGTGAAPAHAVALTPTSGLLGCSVVGLQNTPWWPTEYSMVASQGVSTMCTLFGFNPILWIHATRSSASLHTTASRAQAHADPRVEEGQAAAKGHPPWSTQDHHRLPSACRPAHPSNPPHHRASREGAARWRAREGSVFVSL